MFRWDKEKLIDLACMGELTVPDIAKEMGASLRAVEKQLRYHRGEIEAAREAIKVSERSLIKVLDLWYDGASEAKIAVIVDLALGTVRRLIRMAQLDEEPQDTGAADSLAALQAAHPDKFYEEDVRALTEYSGWRRPTFLLAADCVMPLAEETARYRVDQMPERGVSLAA
jgi:hypothetical protein